jgi:membrane associated rhomboid family serine protease
VRCQRCGNPVCPQCQVQAAVGVHCPDCVRQAARAARPARSILGAPISGGAPVVTITAMALSVVAYLGQQLTGGWLTSEFMLVPGLALVQPWRMVTAAFVHGGLIHLAFNMYALWVIGSFMEQVLGRARLAALYLGSALGGHVLVLIYFRLFDYTWAGAMSGTLGASGAVFGLFAAALVAGRRLGGNISGIVVVIGLNLVFSFTVPGISWQGHVGGLLTGGAMALVYVHAPPARRRLCAVAAPAVVAAVTVAAMFLTR